MIRELIELVAQGIEDVALLIIVGGIVWGMVRYPFHRRQQVENADKPFKEMITPCCWDWSS